MTSNQLKRIFLNGGCLSLDTMRAYQQGKLPRKEAHTVEEHLLACDLCSAALEGLDVRKVPEIDKVSARVQKRLAVYMNTPPRISFFRRYVIHLGFGVVLLIGTSFGIWYSQQDKKSSDSTPTKKIPAETVSQVQRASAGPAVSAYQPSGSTVTESSGLIDPGKTISPVTAGPADNTSAASAAPTEKTTPDLASANTSVVTTPMTSTGSADNTRNTAPEPLEVSIAQIFTRDSYDPNYVASSGTTSNGQLSRTAKRKTNFAPEEMPVFPGGLDAFDAYVKKNFKPVTVNDRSAIKMYSASVSFVVDASTGKVSDVSLMRGISRDVDAEIMRVLQNMPAWQKGKKNGSIIVTAGVKVY